MKTNRYTVNTVPKSPRWPIAAFLGVIALVVFAATVLNASAFIYPTNNGFEQPDLGSGPLSYSYSPIAPGWTFTPQCCSGIAANGSDFNLAGATNGNNDNGATSTSGQAAFLQGATALSERRVALGSRKR
jgi:hypothetical protein